MGIANPSFICNGPCIVNTFFVVRSPGSCSCTGSARGRYLMGLEGEADQSTFGVVAMPSDGLRSDPIHRPGVRTLLRERLVNCLAGAKKLAAYLGGGTALQTSMIVGSVTLEPIAWCTAVHSVQSKRPSFKSVGEDRQVTVEHDGSHRKGGGEFVTGADSAEIMKETSVCIADELKSNAAENADREVRGVKIECPSFHARRRRWGATICRRFWS
jgi:hypothetical protein